MIKISNTNRSQTLTVGVAIQEHFDVRDFQKGMLGFEICRVLAFPVRTFFDPKSGHLCHVLKFTALCRPRDLDVREPSSSCCLLGSSQDGGFDDLPGGLTLSR